MRGAVLVAILCSGCESYVATDGRVFAKDASHSSFDPWPAALVESAAHDLNCSTDDLRVVRNYRSGGGLVVGEGEGLRLMAPLAPPLGIVAGCGKSAIYTVVNDHVVLMRMAPTED